MNFKFSFDNFFLSAVSTFFYNKQQHGYVRFKHFLFNVSTQFLWETRVIESDDDIICDVFVCQLDEFIRLVV